MEFDKERRQVFIRFCFVPDATPAPRGHVESLYDRVPPLLKRWVFSDVVRTKLARNAHGDSSGVRGAAMLWE